VRSFSRVAQSECPIKPAGDRNHSADPANRRVKILFLSGSLEPGKDGVGDYTRTLAAECLRLGHDTFLSSLNDPWVVGQRKEAHALRLGISMRWTERAKALQAFLAANRPQVVSLQFVPYSFHPAGLNLALPQILVAIIGETPVQFMFHEIWIGAESGASAKAKILGFCQRKIIRDLVKTLECRVIHTSNVVYARLLARHGIEAKLLPLFGSISIVAPPGEVKTADRTLSLGLFGSIHPEWNPGEMLAKLRELGRPIRVSHIGRVGPGELVWKKLSEKYRSEVQFCRLGEQSLEKISRFLVSLDFGVATTPLSLIGKSSTTAAMLEHGLPVIVTRNDVHFRGIAEVAEGSESLIPVDERFLDRVTAARKLPPKPRLREVAQTFLSDVADAEQ